MDNANIEYFWTDRCSQQALQADTALTEIANNLHLACREIKRTPPEALYQALGQLRAIRHEYERFSKEFAPFEEKATRALVDHETERQRPAPAPLQPDKTAKVGTPQYERLRSRPGWPNLISPEAAAQAFGIAAEIYYIEQPAWPAQGSFDSKEFLARTKFEKWAKKRASALHHLCILLSEFQRPADRTNGGRAGKQAIAELIRDLAEEWAELDRQVVGALLEAINR